MLTYVEGDLMRSPAKVLVNTVNTVGVMGKGIAKDFKRVYPEMFSRYQELCEAGELTIGKLWLYKTPNKWILNFPTKKHWRTPSQPDYVRQGLQKFSDSYSELGVTNVAFPMLGCGNGELDWENEIRPLMEQHLGDLPISIFIYKNALSVTPEHRDIKNIKQWLRTEPESLAFTEVWRDLEYAARATERFSAIRDTSTTYRISFTEDHISITFAEHDRLKRLTNMIMSSSLVPRRWRETSKNTVRVDRDDMLELWQNIRSYGLCMTRTFPQGLEELSPYLIPLLAELPYLHKTKVESQRGGAETALELRPPRATNSREPAQLSLLELAEA